MGPSLEGRTLPDLIMRSPATDWGMESSNDFNERKIQDIPWNRGIIKLAVA
jgi:hypothetical protein